MNLAAEFDIVIVGAGAAGIGCGVVLQNLGIKNFVILERYQVGASFSRWPSEMRFITPSFPSHGFGLLDLNAIALQTSPGLSLQREHLSGKEYALYLNTAAEFFQLPVQTNTDVKAIEFLPQQQGFTVKTSKGDLQTRFVIWAAGEFQYPNLNPFPGSQLCIHNSQVGTWKNLQGEDFVIIGGYESGMDAAINLVSLGKRVKVLDNRSPWGNFHHDPSVALSLYTLERLKIAHSTGLLELINDAPITKVEAVSGGFAVYAGDEKWISQTQPILCTGFDGSLKAIAHLFDWSEGYASLTQDDESTITPGLFLTGPSVRHGNLIFCFIYKFRQRFAVVANAIAQHLGFDTSPLQVYRQGGMFLDDLSCCNDDCQC
ncbi:MAG: NAD(P)/FAD-dependent oxidoreductase [Rivularia sp. (in: cyanobacteria)]